MRKLEEIARHPSVTVLASGADDMAMTVRGKLRVVVGVGAGWDHVSVSRASRCPTWDEMEEVKRICFREDEVAMQLHVAPRNHVNVHPYCLHIWRPHHAQIPLPPTWMV